MLKWISYDDLYIKNMCGWYDAFPNILRFTPTRWLLLKRAKFYECSAKSAIVNKVHVRFDIFVSFRKQIIYFVHFVYFLFFSPSPPLPLALFGHFIGLIAKPIVQFQCFRWYALGSFHIAIGVEYRLFSIVNILQVQWKFCFRVKLHDRYKCLHIRYVRLHKNIDEHHTFMDEMRNIYANILQTHA